MENMGRKIAVAVTVVILLVFVSTGLGWWLVGKMWELMLVSVVLAIPVLIIIKLIRKIVNSA